MWCKHCRQDVPGIVCGEGGEYRCLRCAQGIYTPQAATPAESGTVDALDVPQPLEASGAEAPSLSDWEAEDRLLHLGRLLGAEKSASDSDPRTKSQRVFRVDAAHQETPARHRSPARHRQHRPDPDDGFSWAAFFIWTILALGLMALVCGGVLLGWSILGRRADLWPVGLPIALAGQVALVVGLILQIDRLRHDYRTPPGSVRAQGTRGERRPDNHSPDLAHPLGPVIPFDDSRWARLAELKCQIDALTDRDGESNRVA